MSAYNLKEGVELLLKPKYYIYYKDIEGFERMEEFSNKEEINAFLKGRTSIVKYKVVSGFDIKEWTK